MESSDLRSTVDTGFEFYLRNVARRWKKEMRRADHVVILSPYLTSKTAESTLAAAIGSDVDVYTRFCLENFAAGASSLKTLFKLLDQGCRLYDLPGLHAKIALIPGFFASIGSQNLTRRGTLNKEATAVLTSAESVAVVSALIKPWLNERRPISFEMLKHAEQLIRPLARRMQRLQLACDESDEQIWKEEHQRTIQKEQLEREAEQEKLNQANRARLRQTLTNAKAFAESELDVDTMTRQDAMHLIESCTWWNHPKTYTPVRAPGHKYGVRGMAGDWKWKLGANTFNISYAVKLCHIHLKYWIERVLVGQETGLPQLKADLRQALQGSVTNHNGDLMIMYPIDCGRMKFGNHFIEVDDFIRWYLVMVGLPRDWGR